MGREKEDKCICKSTYTPSTHYPELSCTVRGTISGRNCNIFSCVVARGRHTEGTSEARVGGGGAYAGRACIYYANQHRDSLRLELICLSARASLTEAGASCAEGRSRVSVRAPGCVCVCVRPRALCHLA